MVEQLEGSSSTQVRHITLPLFLIVLLLLLRCHRHWYFIFYPFFIFCLSMKVEKVFLTPDEFYGTPAISKMFCFSNSNSHDGTYACMIHFCIWFMSNLFNSFGLDSDVEYIFLIFWFINFLSSGIRGRPSLGIRTITVRRQTPPFSFHSPPLSSKMKSIPDYASLSINHDNDDDDSNSFNSDRDIYNKKTINNNNNNNNINLGINHHIKKDLKNKMMNENYYIINPDANSFSKKRVKYESLWIVLKNGILIPTAKQESINLKKTKLKKS